MDADAIGVPESVGDDFKIIREKNLKLQADIENLKSSVDEIKGQLKQVLSLLEKK